MVLLFPSLALGETVKWEDLVHREGIFYKKFSLVPFTGKITGKTQGSFRNGKKEGMWVSYFENGQASQKDEYKNGKREGLYADYYRNGQLLQSGQHKNGKSYGLWVTYKQNGQLGMIVEFRNGKAIKRYK